MCHVYLSGIDIGTNGALLNGIKIPDSSSWNSWLMTPRTRKHISKILVKYVETKEYIYNDSKKP